ncbi:hypothetical protein ACF08M_11915 [Streptomyces sp. NPDC015032]|uniref:hypothetical protein n=1 Tax=Streptomyces sp. NPDC015032 TaxID=3364937 RepID=UPI0036FC0316
MARSCSFAPLGLDGSLADGEPDADEPARRLLGRHGVADSTWRQSARFLGIGNREALTVLRAEYPSARYPCTGRPPPPSGGGVRNPRRGRPGESVRTPGEPFGVSPRSGGPIS